MVQSMESLEKGTLIRGELQRSAANICRFLMTSPAFVRMTSGESELDKMLRESCSEEEKAIQNIIMDKVSEEVAPTAVEKNDCPVRVSCNRH